MMTPDRRVTDPAEVAAALARLVDDAPDSARARRVVDEAETAFSDVETAARFVDDGGEPRLRAAVELAHGRGDDDVADRGRTLLKSLARYRAAARGGSIAFDRRR